MFNISAFVICLLVASSTHAKSDLTKELSKIDFQEEKRSCDSFNTDLNKIKMYTEVPHDEGSKFHSKELALEGLSVLEKHNFEPTHDSVKALTLLSEADHWPKDKAFEEEMSKIVGECGLFLKYEFFKAYSLDHERLNFSALESDRFRKQIDKYVRASYRSPNYFLPITMRISLLPFLNQAKILGRPADLQAINELMAEAVKEESKLRKMMEDKKSAEEIQKFEFALGRKYSQRLELLYDKLSMKD